MDFWRQVYGTSDSEPRSIAGNTDAITGRRISRLLQSRGGERGGHAGLLACLRFCMHSSPGFGLLEDLTNVLATSYAGRKQLHGLNARSRPSVPSVLHFRIVGYLSTKISADYNSIALYLLFACSSALCRERERGITRLDEPISCQLNRQITTMVLRVSSAHVPRLVATLENGRNAASAIHSHSSTPPGILFLTHIPGMARGQSSAALIPRCG